MIETGFYQLYLIFRYTSLYTWYLPPAVKQKDREPISVEQYFYSSAIRSQLHLKPREIEKSSMQ